MRVIEKVTVGKRGDGSLMRVEGQPNWFSLICVRGKQHEISTGTPDLKLAKRFHRQKLDELAADRQGLKQFTCAFHLFVDRLTPPAGGIRDGAHRRVAPPPPCPGSATAHCEARVRL